MNIGLFINNVISFCIVVFVLFMAIKAMNQLHRKQQEEPQGELPPSREAQLLEELTPWSARGFACAEAPALE